MKLLQKVFLVSLVVLVISGGAYLYNQATDGFNLQQITSTLPPAPEFEVALSLDQKKMLQSTLAQPFHYLGKGAQCYAFESADGKYVLKFFKHKHLHSWKWLESVPMPCFLRRISEAKILRRQQRAHQLFLSCLLSYEEIADETGYHYIHLNRTPALEIEVTLIDKVGLRSTIQLDQYEYVIQKKGLLIGDVFATIRSEAEACVRVEQLIDAIVRRAKMGIVDHDRAFVQNIAFDPEKPRAFFIDSGQFDKSAEPITNEALRAEVKRRLGSLRHWAEQYFPQYVSTIETYLSSFS
ncbi:MAG: hypothetical protein S4CHLAM2_13300 [Chlamydiales bacterium]|nr:hypothetical protein [Chlamydiales bacterium]